MLVRLLSLVLLSAAGPLWGRPLDRHDVPSGAIWLIHIDVDAANASVLGKGIRELLLSRPETRLALDKARDAIGIDLTRDIQDVTIVGFTFAPGHGLLMVRGKVDRPRVLALIGKSNSFRVRAVEGHEIYSWIDPGPPRRADPMTPDGEKLASPDGATSPHATSHGEHWVSGAFSGQDRVILSPNADEVVISLRVLHGDAPALAEDSPLATVGPRGTILQAGVIGLADAPGLPIESPILRQCEAGSLFIGEDAGDSFFTARVTTRSSQTAQRIKEIVEGARAMAQLQADDAPQLVRLIEPLQVIVEGQIVTAHWAFASSQLLDIIKSQALSGQPSTTGEPTR